MNLARVVHQLFESDASTNVDITNAWSISYQLSLSVIEGIPEELQYFNLNDLIEAYLISKKGHSENVRLGLTVIHWVVLQSKIGYDSKYPIPDEAGFSSGICYNVIVSRSRVMGCVQTIYASFRDKLHVQSASNSTMAIISSLLVHIYLQISTFYSSAKDCFDYYMKELEESLALAGDDGFSFGCLALEILSQLFQMASTMEQLNRSIFSFRSEILLLLFAIQKKYQKHRDMITKRLVQQLLRLPKPVKDSFGSAESATDSSSEVIALVWLQCVNLAGNEYTDLMAASTLLCLLLSNPELPAIRALSTYPRLWTIALSCLLHENMLLRKRGAFILQCLPRHPAHPANALGGISNTHLIVFK